MDEVLVLNVRNIGSVLQDARVLIYGKQGALGFDGLQRINNWCICLHQHVAPCDSQLAAMTAVLPGKFCGTHKVLALRVPSRSP